MVKEYMGPLGKYYEPLNYTIDAERYNYFVKYDSLSYEIKTVVAKYSSSDSLSWQLPSSTTNGYYQITPKTGTAGFYIYVGGGTTEPVIILYRELKNTPPTMPGSFTQPSGNLETGDSKVFSVGPASDAESNLSKYIWEASINGGAYSKVGETTANSLLYTIPSATSLKMRVKAVDSAGLESAYRESSLYNVQPPQYYYDKYTIDAKRTYQDNAPWTYSYDTETSVEGLRKNYTLDTATNKYLLGELWGPGVSITDKALIYNAAFDGSFLARYELPAFSGTGNTSHRYQLVKVYIKYADKNTYTTQDVRGSLVLTGVIGSATAYPADGRHTDGFWYVRKSRVNQSIAPPTPFTSPTQGKKFKPNEEATITFGASNAANLSLYEVDYRYNTTGYHITIHFLVVSQLLQTRHLKR